MRPLEADRPGAADATAAGVGIYPSSVRAILCDRDRADARSRLPAIVGSAYERPIVFASLVLRRTRRRAIGDAIETSSSGCRRYQIEAEFLADDARKKAAHRVLLPSRSMHHGIDAYATRRA